MRVGIVERALSYCSEPKNERKNCCDGNQRWKTYFNVKLIEEGIFAPRSNHARSGWGCYRCCEFYLDQVAHINVDRVINRCSRWIREQGESAWHKAIR